MTTPVLWLSLDPNVPARDYWDHALLSDLFADADQTTELGDVSAPHATVVLPGAGHAGMEEAVTAALAALPAVTLVVTSDEEHRFDAGAVEHPALRVFRQYPRLEDTATPLPIGYTPHVRGDLAALGDLPRTTDLSFAGQVTHERRVECAAAVTELGGTVHASPGFAQGLAHHDYARLLVGSKVVACPSGPCHPDSFRIYETLEAGAVPLVDARAPGWDHDWWPSWMHDGPVPFPVVGEWGGIAEVVGEVLSDWALTAARCQAWWIGRKRALRLALLDEGWVGA